MKSMLLNSLLLLKVFLVASLRLGNKDPTDHNEAPTETPGGTKELALTGYKGPDHYFVAGAALSDPRSCANPEMSGKPWCECPVKDYYACKNKWFCKDRWGFCDPAETWDGAFTKMLTSWYWPTFTCTTTTNPANSQTECKKSFVADFIHNGESCVCYEQSVTAPPQKDKMLGPVSYLDHLLNSHKSGFPYLYNGSKIEPVTCAERGIRYDKKVHPCQRHGYTSFRNAECQAAYRIHRKEEIEHHGQQKQEFTAEDIMGYMEYAWRKSLHPEWKGLTVTEGMYAGRCNTGK